MSAENRRGMVTEIKNHHPDVKKKLLVSGILGTGIFTANWIGVPVFALKESALALSHLPENWNRESVLVIIYGVHAGASLFNLIQEGRLLKNPKIELSQDIPATLAYHRLEKVKNLKEKKAKRSITAVIFSEALSLPWTILRESTFISLALLSDDKMEKLFVLKSAQAMLSLLQIGGAEIALRTIGREKKSKPASQKGEQNLPPSGTIVDLGQINKL